jgi:hypothetical protein
LKNILDSGVLKDGTEKKTSEESRRRRRLVDVSCSVPGHGINGVKHVSAITNSWLICQRSLYRVVLITVSEYLVLRHDQYQYDRILRASNYHLQQNLSIHWNTNIHLIASLFSGGSSPLCVFNNVS